MAAWSVVLGFAAILLVFRTTDWRGLIRQAQDEADREEAAEPRGRPPRAVSSTSPGSGPAPATARAGVSPAGNS